MAKNECVACVWELSTGRKIDTSKAKTSWAEEVGVSEKSIRRHLAHPPDYVFASRPSKSTAGDSELHDPDGTSHYTISSEVAWGYEDFREFIRSKGQDPDAVTFGWGVTTNPSGGVWNKLSNVRPKREGALEAMSLAEAYRRAEKFVHKPRKRAGGGVGLVVAISDLQVGKVDRRGGTPELLVRLREYRAEVRDILARNDYERILFVDGGDLIENFESGGNPMFTNDLSLPDQLDVAATEILEWAKMLVQYAPVTAMTVPSNHSAWRRGKQTLGKPSDDFGIFIHKQVEKMLRLSNVDESWYSLVLPEEYDESVCVDFLGTPVGLVHGNQFGPGRAVDWWTGQAFGNQAVARADVLMTGHYHTAGYAEVAESPFTGRQRHWVGLPTTDSGSSWFRNARGRESLPGVVTFEITPDGFDLGSLRVV